MSKVCSMPALSSEEIRRISETAVATVAAQKIVTNKSAFISPPLGAKILSKASQVLGNQASQRLKPSNSGLLNRARALASSVLSQSNGRQYFQESFDQVKKNRKV